MWKLLQESPTAYAIQFNKENGYEIFITDFIYLWHVYFTEITFLTQLKESNDGIEFENDSQLLQDGIKLLVQPENLKKVNVFEENEKRNLSITLVMSCGFPFKLKCRLSRVSDEMMFQKITQNLLKIINDLWMSQTILRNTLNKKDKELTAYKTKFGEIQHKHKKTEPFNDELHMNTHNMYETHFGGSAIPSSILQKTIVLPQQPIKTECSSESELQTIQIKQEIMTPTTEDQNHFAVNHSVKRETTKVDPPVNGRVCVKKKRKGLNF